MKRIANPVALTILVSAPAFANNAYTGQTLTQAIELMALNESEIKTGYQKVSQGPPGTDDDHPNGGAADAVIHISGMPVPLTPSSSDTLVIGIRVASIGGAGYVPNAHDNGGNGGDGNEVTVTNNVGADVTIYAPTASGANLQHGVIGLLGSSRGGEGAMPDAGDIDHYGGIGGSSANSTVNSYATVSLGTQSAYLNGNDMGWGVVAQSIGGKGGNETKGDNTDGKPTGRGGNAGTVNANVTGDVSVYWSPTADTACSNAFGISNCSSVAAVVASSVGGTGGQNDWTHDFGGDGGHAAKATATVGVQGASSISTNITAATSQATRDNSAAILVMSIGGHGGGYGTDKGNGGDGGSSSAATANVYNTSVNTEGDSLSGVQVLSKGGNGGGNVPGTNSDDTTGGDGGAVGTATANLFGTSVTTTGTISYGVLVQSIGGLGGLGDSQGGNGTGGYIVNANLDSGSSVTTGGDYAAAVVSQSLAGAGGSGGAWTSWIEGNSGDGGAGGGGGEANANTTATLITTGNYAHGVLVHSIGGSGGTGATASGVVVALGGDGGSGGDGNIVTGTLGGSITTSGTGSIGGLMQSIGGGGGNAGSASGVISVGGTGGSASHGGEVTVNLSGNITTTGEAGIGVLGQSIGGGGGNAGSAAGVSAIGGQGGDGGYGSAATLNMNSGTDIQTSGLYGHGAIIQSIGGGGGNGGSVFSVSVDPGDVAPPALGGSGGGGGVGAVVNVTSNAASVTTTGHGAVGLLAQSIGGGGGTGGSSKQDSVSIVSLAIGGSGGSGGNSDDVTVDLTSSTIGTQGIAAPAIVAQSIGGGGGNGGAANSTSADAFINADMTIGGSGGGGGGSGTTTVGLTGTTVTTADGQSNTAIADSYGVLAQAIGGGGGNGGSSQADSLAIALPTDGGSVAVSTSLAIGGKGAGGGRGGILDVHLLNGSSVSTGGVGSHGVLAQTIGGGGGAGGASHSMSTTSTKAAPDALTFAVSSAVGGSSAGGGYGGQVTLHVDSTSSITTHDDFSNALIGQSIGGGGGNAGVGSSKTGGAGQAIDAKIGVGGTGGNGGDGGVMTVNLDPGSVLQTYGSGSRGMVLQSIGGGGGASQGGTIQLSGAASGGDGDDDSGGYQATVGVSLGATGGGAGDGGAVTATAQGAINTTGDDADGILVQSIGGGGGLAGSAGADAGGAGSSSSSDALLGGDDDSNSYTLKLAVGGHGGIAGGGGEVIFKDFTGTVSTQGIHADGIVLQSIGGGGGVGGTATASGVTGSTNVTVAVGGQGGAAGNASPISIDLQGDGTMNSGAVSTQGDVAYGLLVQSIGGGGGQGADGSANTAQSSDSTSSVTLGASGASPNGGWGGEISGGMGGDSGDGMVFSASTSGFNAHAIVLQSIGGGGGTASVATVGVQGEGSTPNFNLSLGGGGGKDNSGASSPVTKSSGGQINIKSWLNVHTTGEHAFGLVAQSIGGGGGIIASGAASNVDNIAIAGDATSQGLNANAVNITIGNYGSQASTNNPSVISTTGKGAHGIVLQSIGGGGGIAGYTANGDLSPGWNGTPSDSVRGNTNSGRDIVLNYTGTLTTTGDGAFGIIAQSISDGGGLAGNNSGSYAGSAYDHLAQGAAGSPAGNVTINQHGNLSVSGNNTYAIFAQSDGNVDNTNAVKINIYGTVAASSDSDPTSGGVWFDGTASTNNLVIQDGGRLLVPNHDYAVRRTGNTAASVTNFGQVSGSMSLSAPGVAMGTAENFGTMFNANDIHGHVINHGDFLVGESAGAARTHITGDFTQTADGTLHVGADFIARTADVMQVDGVAQLNGKIRVNSSRLMPNQSVVFLQSDHIDQTATPQSASLLFDYMTRYAGNQATVTAGQAHFDTLSESYGAGRNLRELGTHLQDIWDRGGNEDLAGLYATLDQASQSASGFKDALSSLAPGIAAAPAALKQADMARFASSLLSCPHYLGDAVRLSESSCVWGNIAARSTSVDGSHGTSSFDASGVTYQVGVQRQIAPQWFAGVSAAYENGHISADDGRQSMSGDTGYLGASLKYENGPWMVAGTLSGSYGSYDSTRYIRLPGNHASAKSSPDVMSLGQRLRVAYTHNLGKAYIKPAVDLDVIYTRMPSYSEHGAGALNLNYDSSDQWTAILTPGVEVGGRIDLNNDHVLRPYLNVGMSLSSTDHWDSYAKLASAPAGSRHAKSTLDAGRTFGRVTAGMQWFGGEQFDIRLQYDGLFSSQVRSHGGMLKASWRY